MRVVQGTIRSAGTDKSHKQLGLEPVVVAKDKGEFDLSHAQPFEAIALLVEARGMAPKIGTNLASGGERHRVVVTDGAVIHGREKFDRNCRNSSATCQRSGSCLFTPRRDSKFHAEGRLMRSEAFL